MLLPREAGKYITKNALDVRICEDGIQKTAKMLTNLIKERKISVASFKENEVFPLGRELSLEQLVNWVFVIDSLNFNFWTPKGKPKFSIKYDKRKRSGYLAMVGAMNRAIDEGKLIYDASYYSKLSLPELKDIFRSDNNIEIPMLEERFKALSEVGKILIDKFDGSFLSVLEKACGSAVKLVSIVSSEFPCFNDVHEFGGESVCILKRAQILAADIWLLYEGKGLGDFRDLNELTMFADYRVPQSLVYFQILSYSDELSKKLQNDYLFRSGDRQEVEIRGVSIHAIELLVEATNKLLENELTQERINSVKLDFFMWNYRLENAEALENIPYHKVRSIYY